MTGRNTPRRLVTSIYMKTQPEARAPDDDECYYMLTRSGLFIGRNTRFARSLVPARQCPGELAPQEPELALSYPKVPAGLLGRITGFFWTIASRHGGEAVVLLAIDESSREIRPIVPTQIATIGFDWRGQTYPIGLHYHIPQLDRGLRLFGDIHSHAFESAYASTVDVRDEQHWPGLHVVAGRLNQDPPQWHVEYVVDGTRLDVAADAVLDLDGYQGRTTGVDAAWVSRVRVESGKYYQGRLQDQDQYQGQGRSQATSYPQEPPHPPTALTP